jgi:hypothetical protein
MTLLRQSLTAALLLIPAIVLCAYAAPHFLNGVAVDGTIPVPNYMIAQIAMPKAAYEDAVIALAQASPRDGSAAIARAEAALHAGAQPLSQAPILTQGLMQEPASARGWLLLSNVWAPADKRKAAQALAQALVLAPHDYWLIGARAKQAAILWPDLDADTQALALEQARMLWEEPILRSQLQPLLSSPEGVHLVARAFAGQPDEIREMNRWLSAQSVQQAR